MNRFLMRLVECGLFTLVIAFVATQTAAALPAVNLAGAEAGKAQEVVSPPAPSDVVNAKKVFVEDEGASPETYSRFVAALSAWGRYTLVRSPSEANVIFAFHDEPLSVTVIEPSTQVVVTTVSAPYVPLRRDQNQEATLAAQNLVSAIKQLVGAPLSAQEIAQITQPVVGKHSGLIVSIVIVGSLAIAGGVFALLHGRGH